MLAFIFTDFLKNSKDDVDRLDLATVWGEPIDETEFYDLKEQFIERDRQQAISQGREWDESTMAASSEDQAFNEVVRRILMNTEFEKIGINCTVDELNDMIHGNHVHPWVTQIPIFQNPRTGAFERDSVRMFISNLDPEMEPDDADQRERWLEARRQWKAFEDELKDNRKAEKYVTLIKKGMFVNDLEAREFYNEQQEIRNISFVIQRFTDIEKDEFTVTDEEIEAYYNEHKDEAKYEQEESRDIEYITFSIAPTEVDRDMVEMSLSDLKQPFAMTENNVAFMEQNSQGDLTTDSMYFNMGTESFLLGGMFGRFEYPASMDEAVQQAKVGDVLGPIEFVDPQEQDVTQFAIAKVTRMKKENQAWVRHILIKTDETRSESQAKAKADSIIKVIQEKDNFVEMVSAFTDDPGSIANNGEYKWFPEGRMVPEFNDASFNGPIGKLQLVKTTYGYHIVEVLGRTERNVPALAVITKRVEPSEASIKNMEETVFDFIFKINESGKDSAFHRAAEDSSLTVQSTRVWMAQRYVMGLNNSEGVLQFAFGLHTKEGDISDPIFDEDKYVVAYLSNIIEEGTPEFRDVKDQMRVPALREKQANYYTEKMSGKNSLEEVAKVVKDPTILDADVKFGVNTIQGGGGNEPEVIGHLFTNIPVGSMTKPIMGNAGIYVIVLNSITPAPETADYSEQRSTLQSSRANAADGAVMVALREMADVQDNRRKKELQGN